MHHDYNCTVIINGSVDALYTIALNAPMLAHRCAITTVSGWLLTVCMQAAHLQFLQNLPLARVFFGDTAVLHM